MGLLPFILALQIPNVLLRRVFVTLSGFTKLEMFKQPTLVHRVVWCLPGIVNLQVGWHPTGTSFTHTVAPADAISSPLLTSISCVGNM